MIMDNPVNFVVDDLYVCSLFTEVETHAALIKELADLIQNCRSLSMANVYLTCDIYKKNTEVSLSLAETIFGEGLLSHNRDLLLRIARLFDLCFQYNPEDYFSDDPNLSEDFHYFLSTSDADVGLITKNNYTHHPWWRYSKMHHINQDLVALQYCRACISKLVVEETFFWEIAQELFPRIYFNEDPNRLRFSNLSIPGSSALVLNWVVKVLSYLNDFSISDFQASQHSDFISRASAKGVNLSPESPNTRADPHKIRQRNINIAGVTVCCEWHAKYAYDRGRIYFHIGQSLGAQIAGRTKGKVIVGIFHQHLDV